jgi:hypothetical protein
LWTWVIPIGPFGLGPSWPRTTMCSSTMWLLGPWGGWMLSSIGPPPPPTLSYFDYSWVHLLLRFCAV